MTVLVDSIQNEHPNEDIQGLGFGTVIRLEVEPLEQFCSKDQGYGTLGQKELQEVSRKCFVGESN